MKLRDSLLVGVLLLVGLCVPGQARQRSNLTEERPDLACLSITPDGKTVAFGSPDGILRLRYLEQDGAVRRWSVRGIILGKSITSVALSADGRTLAIGGGNATQGEVELRDATNGKRQRTIKGFRGLVCSVALSPDNKTLATGGADKTVRLWDLDKGNRLASLQGHAEPVDSLTFSPDGKTLASGGRDGTVRLWDVSTQQLRCSLKGHTVAVTCMVYSPDGKVLVSGSYDKTVKFWEATTGREHLTIEAEQGRITSVAISRDGMTLAVANGRNLLLFPMKDLLAMPMGSKSRKSFRGDKQVECVAFGQGTAKGDGYWIILATHTGEVKEYQVFELEPEIEKLEGATMIKESRLKDLLKEQRAASRDVFDTTLKEYLAGRATVTGLAQVSQSIFETDLALCDGRTDRIAAHEKHIKQMKEYERTEKARFEFGRCAVSVFKSMQAARLDAEVALLRELSRDPGARSEAANTKKLLSEKRDALRVIFQASEIEFKVGRVSFEGVLDDYRRLLEAELELTDNPANRVAAYEKLLEMEKDCDAINEERFKAGRITTTEYAWNKAAYRLDEILLLQERSKSKAEPAKLDKMKKLIDERRNALLQVRDILRKTVEAAINQAHEDSHLLENTRLLLQAELELAENVGDQLKSLQAYFELLKKYEGLGKKWLAAGLLSPADYTSISASRRDAEIRLLQAHSK